MSSPVAVVSGASRGIGRAIALHLAREGYDIAGTWVRDSNAADALAHDVEATGRTCLTVRADAADPVATADAVTRIAEHFGRADVLVHNAGVASRGHHLVDTDPAEVQRLFAINALGAMYLTTGLIELLRASDHAAVVLVSSVATSNAAPGGGPYMIGKAAVEAFASTLAAEEAPNGVRVNVVAPGLVSTTMGDRLTKALTGLDDAAALDASMPFGRVTRPEDVAALVTFLASPAASQITGQRIEIHGGRAAVAP